MVDESRLIVGKVREHVDVYLQDASVEVVVWKPGRGREPLRQFHFGKKFDGQGLEIFGRVVDVFVVVGDVGLFSFRRRRRHDLSGRSRTGG